MPERYQPDPWIDTDVFAEHTGRLGARIPQQPMYWIDATVGDRLFVAPKSPTEVVVGYTVPNILGDLRVNKSYRTKQPFRKLPAFCFDYLDIEEDGETLRFRKIDTDRFVIEVLR